MTEGSPAQEGGAQLEKRWRGIVDNLPPNERIWLTSSRPLMLAESTAVVAVPNEFTRTQLEGRLRTRIEDTLSDRLGKPVRLAVSVDPALEEEIDESAQDAAEPAWGEVDAPANGGPQRQRQPDGWSRVFADVST